MKDPHKGTNTFLDEYFSLEPIETLARQLLGENVPLFYLYTKPDDHNADTNANGTKPHKLTDSGIVLMNDYLNQVTT